MARLVTILGFVCAFAGASLHAATFTVTTTADSGAGSLRQAILDSNANGAGETDSIAFNIPAAGTQVIFANSVLPTITTPVIIDGYTQPGSTPNTLLLNAGDNAVLRIVLDGGTGSYAGLTFDATAMNSIVRGLNIRRFSTGIVVNGADAMQITGNFIGTDETGTTGFGNGYGIRVETGSLGVIIGGVTPALRNVISGNEFANVFLAPGTQANTVEGNYIGLTASGTSSLLGFAGVRAEGSSHFIRRNVISGHNLVAVGEPAAIVLANTAFDIEITHNFIGTTMTGTGSLPNRYGIIFVGDGVSSPQDNTIGADGAPNVIANSAFTGIGIPALTPQSDNNSILFNTFRNNGQLAIDLNHNGPTANDALDADTGANNLQNHPIITSAVQSTGGAMIVTGTLASLPSTQFRIQLYFDIACNATNRGQGGTVSEQLVTTDPAGNASFTFTFPSLPPNGILSATATNNSTIDTSEFSPCLAAVQEDPQLTIGDAIVTEGNGGTTLANFTVTLTPASAFPVSVNVQTSDVTALAGSDYVANATTLNFAPGQTTQTFSVTVNGDTNVEPTETFAVTLSAPVNASIADTTGTGTITNDDVAGAPVDLSISKSGPATITAGGSVIYTLTVMNTGSTPATNVTVNDTLPAALTFVSANASQGSCNAANPVICSLGTLNAGATATITIQATASTTPQPVANTASVSATESDPNATNNASTSNATIAPATAPAPIPSLSSIGLIAVTALLAAFALTKLR